MFKSILLVAMQLAVTSDMVELSGQGDVGLKWDCDRDQSRDKLTLDEVQTDGGRYPRFTRQLPGEWEQVVVDCPAEVHAYRERSLSLSSGFCENQWGLELRLNDENPDLASADLRLGDEWIRGYSCQRRKS